MLRHFDRNRISCLKLYRLAFLLAKETETGGGSAFYEFVPYRRGPYSFTLDHEVDNLIRDGLVEASGVNAWQLTARGMKEPLSIPDKIRDDLHNILKRYGDWQVPQLSRTISRRHPWFAANHTDASSDRWTRPISEPAVYTIGYEGRSVDGFLNRLLQAGIRRVIDVRDNPISRRYGYHKSTFSRLCSLLDIQYSHFPELGIPSEQRANAHSKADYQGLFDVYENRILSDRCGAIARVADLVVAEPSALVCKEARAGACHRSRLSKQVTLQTDLPTVHLE
jgi:hypothetical protein